MSTPARAVSQTRSFSTIFLIELWERFGYYGMAAILVLFMVEKIGFGDTQANLVWGAFTALVYAAPAIGGWVGDNVLGTRRTMPIGAAILSIGYLMLSIPSDSLYLLYASMGVIVVGNGLFKANARTWSAASTKATTRRSTARSRCTTWPSTSARPYRCC
jgi:POT family proton-dependent oligopeptide transporter